MDMLNDLYITGNVCREPQIVDLNKDNQVVNFEIAVNDYKKNKQGEMYQNTGYFSCSAYGKLCDYLIKKDFKKGDEISFKGKLEYQKWIKDDIKKAKVNLIVSRVIGLKSKSKDREENDTD